MPVLDLVHRFLARVVRWENTTPTLLRLAEENVLSWFALGGYGVGGRVPRISRCIAYCRLSVYEQAVGNFVISVLVQQELDILLNRLSH